jgi:hypothetical protein
LAALGVQIATDKSDEEPNMKQTLWIVLGALVCMLAVSACGPNEKKRAELAESRRIECLDKVCEGDTPPKAKDGESVMKLNGQWYFAPGQYVMGFSTLVFYWPSKTPVTGRTDSQSFPDKRKDFYDEAVEIFLRHHDGVTHSPNRYSRLLQAEVEGRLISKSTPRPGLEVWRIREADASHPIVWFVATAYVARDPNGAVVACDESDSRDDRCTTAFIWKSGIAADMRFRAKHAPDWPEIYQEATRILQLLRKA